MNCPHCGDEHHLDTPCRKENDHKPDTRTEDKHALAGLDNPFWKPENPAAA